jgi:hypothetical protein
MTKPLSTMAGADLLAPFGLGRGSLLLTPAGLEGYFKQFCTPAPALTL